MMVVVSSEGQVERKQLPALLSRTNGRCTGLEVLSEAIIPSNQAAASWKLIKERI